MWGFWFVFPIVGVIFMIIMMFQFFRKRGGMCGFYKEGESESLKKEIGELRTQLDALRRKTKEDRL